MPIPMTISLLIDILPTTIIIMAFTRMMLNTGITIFFIGFARIVFQVRQISSWHLIRLMLLYAQQQQAYRARLHVIEI